MLSLQGRNVQHLDHARRRCVLDIVACALWSTDGKMTESRSFFSGLTFDFVLQRLDKLKDPPDATIEYGQLC